MSTDQNVAPDPEVPDLIVKSGNLRTIEPQRWEFSELVIETGATLAIREGSKDPLHLVIRGSATIHGTILGERAYTGNRDIEFQSASGERICWTYSDTNLGGNGGMGGQAGGNAGGAGANGSTAGGGGGGGGGGRFQQRPKPYVTNYPGKAANGTRGGEAQQCCAAGGDGGMRERYSNGAALILEVHGDFDGKGGQIRLNGSEGSRGADGPKGALATSPYGCQTGGGGGGGGGPGGHGGFFIAEIHGQIKDYADVQTHGGEGGPPGQALPPNAGTNGTRGDPGPEGKLRWLKVKSTRN